MQKTNFLVRDNLRLNTNKLLKFGFKNVNGELTYVQSLVGGQFELTIIIINEREINTRLIEIETGESYTLHLIDSASSNFVGRIKDEYNEVINKIIRNCCEKDVFKNTITLELIDYINKIYGDELEYLWEKFPNNAIVRRKDSEKWYAAFLTVSKEKLGFKDKTVVEIIDLRANNVEEIVDNDNIFAGYHMNKKHWITIILDGSVSCQIIKEKINESYALAKNKGR